MHQNADLRVKFQKFYGGYAPDPHPWEGLRRTSPDPIPPSALRRLRASLRVLAPPSSPPPNQKSWAHPLSQNPGYAHAVVFGKYRRAHLGYAPGPHPGRGYGAPPQTQPPRCSSLGAFGPSIVASEPEILHPPQGAPTLSKSWLRPCYKTASTQSGQFLVTKKSAEHSTMALLLLLPL